MLLLHTRLAPGGKVVIAEQGGGLIWCTSLAMMAAAAALSQGANLDRLHAMVILGSSMRSHADAAPLLAALEAADGRQEEGGMTDLVTLLDRQGRLVEVAAPDCAAHGVGVAVHMFRALRRSK